jgi:NADH:ubiquinone oxidoreductase subunit 6 (subunit J)
MTEWILYGFLLVAAVGAISLVFIRNVFHAALALLVVSLSVAGIFVCLMAEFLAVTQLLIYAGGVIVIFIFGIMLTTRMLGKPLIAPSKSSWASLLISGALFVLMTKFVLGVEFNVPVPIRYDQYIKDLGLTLYTRYSYAFELAGLLLLVSLVAASVSAFSKSKTDA